MLKPEDQVILRHDSLHVSLDPLEAGLQSQESRHLVLGHFTVPFAVQPLPVQQPQLIRHAVKDKKEQGSDV